MEQGDSRLQLAVRHNETSLQAIPEVKVHVVSKTYGKGKTVARRKKESGNLIFSPDGGIKAISTRSADGSRYPAWLEDGALDTLDLGSEKDGEEAWRRLRDCQPVCLTHSGLAATLTDQMPLDRLEQLFEPGCTVEAILCIGNENMFQLCDTSKNTFGSTYHVREPRCKPMQLPFDDFSQNLRQWSQRSTMLRLPVRQWLPTADGDSGYALQDNPGCPSRLRRLIADSISWDWLEGLQRRHHMGPVTDATLEVGGRNALLPMQYSVQDRMILQLHGTRKVLVVGPDHSFKGLYPFPVHHPYDGYSMVDWEQPDGTAWPASAGVRGRACLLKPGDVLFVPSCWWVHQQLMGRESVGMCFTLGTGHRLRPRPAITLRVSRVVEELLGDLQGPGSILRWLEILCAEQEQQSIDVSTVDGFKQTEAVWEARDAVDEVLGWMAWKDVFRAMSHRRLIPTPWLNKDFKEPLYLTDKPRIIEDTRTAEQKRYPELFRHVKG